jgi:hypothetical protein
MVRRMVFDVESTGLHGRPFAVGWVVLEGRNEIESGWFSTGVIHGEYVNDWVMRNVPQEVLSPGPKSLMDQFEMCSAFMDKWKSFSSVPWSGEKRAALWADVAWPVEAKFLSMCRTLLPDLDDNEFPYPLYDISTLVPVAGIQTNDKSFASEMPHHPLDDARASARLLVACLDRLRVEL